MEEARRQREAEELRRLQLDAVNVSLPPTQSSLELQSLRQRAILAQQRAAEAAAAAAAANAIVEAFEKNSPNGSDRSTPHPVSPAPSGRRPSQETEDFDLQIRQLKEQLQALERRAASSRLEEQEQQRTTMRGGSVAEATAPSPSDTLIQQLVSRLANLPPRDERPRITFKEEADMLATFTGLDPTLPLRVWAEKVDELARASRWTDYEKFFAAKRALRGPAEDWLASQRGITTWEALRDGLAKTFKRTIDPYTIHEELRKEAPKKDEPLVQYVHRMQRKGSQAGLEESVIVRYIVRSIPDRSRFKISLYACRTIDQLLDALAVYEEAARYDKEDTAFKGGPPTRSTSHRTSEPDRSRDTSSTNKSNKCFNCGATGHRGSECPSKEAGPLCFSCRKSGHRAKECPENKKRSNVPNSQPINVIYGAGQDRSRKDAVIEGIPVVALLDSGAHRNVLREDVWREIATNLTPTPELERHEGTLNGFGGAVVRPRGRVTLSTRLDGTEYQLDYVVVPRNAAREKVFIGDPLRDVAKITLDRDGATIEPLVEPEENDEEQVLEGVEEGSCDEVGVISREPTEEERVPVEVKVTPKDEAPIYHELRSLSKEETKEIEEVEQQAEERPGEEIVGPGNLEFASNTTVAREQEGIARDLRQTMAKASVFQPYHPDRETELHTEVGKDELIAILFQRSPDDRLMHSVDGMSHETTPVERGCSNHELEFLAVIRALDKFRNCLLNRRFKLVTNGAALRAIMEKKDLTPRVIRWVMLIEEFNCETEHRPSTNMRRVDILSRRDPPDRYAIEKAGDVEEPGGTTTSVGNTKPWRGFRDNLKEDEDCDETRDENNNEDK